VNVMTGAPERAVIHELVALDAALGPAELEEGAHRPVADAAPESEHAAVPAQHWVQCPGGQTHFGWDARTSAAKGTKSESGCRTSDLARKTFSAEHRQRSS